MAGNPTNDLAGSILILRSKHIVKKSFHAIFAAETISLRIRSVCFWMHTSEFMKPIVATRKISWPRWEMTDRLNTLFNLVATWKELLKLSVKLEGATLYE